MDSQLGDDGFGLPYLLGAILEFVAASKASRDWQLGVRVALRFSGDKPPDSETAEARRAEADWRKKSRNGGASLDLAILPVMPLSDALSATMSAGEQVVCTG